MVQLLTCVIYVPQHLEIQHSEETTMLGEYTLSERSIADGITVQAGSSSLSAIATQLSAAAGTLVGSTSISSNFTKTSVAILVHGGVASLSSNFSKTSAGTNLTVDNRDAGILWQDKQSVAFPETWSTITTSSDEETWTSVNTKTNEETWT